MTVELVTGFSGTEHVTSGQDGARQAGTVGTGKYVLMTNDDPLAAKLENANTVTVGPGDVLINGRHVQLTGATTFSIPVGTQAQQTSNLLVIRYSRDDSGVEKAEALTLTGEPAASDPQDPATNDGNILDGDTPVDMALYRVITTGIETAQPVKLFSTIEPMSELPGASGEPLPISLGGTGATTADGALKNLGALGTDTWNETIASATGIFNANRGMVNSANWETLYNLAPGSYILSNSATNSPVPRYYGNMTVARAGGNRVSILVAFDNGQVWTIVGAQSTNGNASGWRQIATCGQMSEKLLWSGYWSSGSISVPGASQYNLFIVSCSEPVACLCLRRGMGSSTVAGGSTGWKGDGQNKTYTAVCTFTISGDTLSAPIWETFNMVTNEKYGHVITDIYGVI